MLPYLSAVPVVAPGVIQEARAPVPGALWPVQCLAKQTHPPLNESHRPNLEKCIAGLLKTTTEGKKNFQREREKKKQNKTQ